ncbi:hypothetical protein COU60_01440 [Candidatus Pacearchaeota archaeon CG10_big_fil_rev_8_21_14_0_10_34_76]|nr:MAG: hypothetical protein COU60_01440 [Candidatus Pacearchaeota archaeon CG10_big_fil_rev_8_21_14_0_10_34_76]
MEDVVLPDTTLCAIVRDEVMNPAGGVLRFLRSVMPHVVEGIVVDTGSIDGTRELLERAKRDFPNLKVFDYEFNGYAESRNFSLKFCETERALILDADELILQEDYPRIARTLKRAPCAARWDFDFKDVFDFGVYDGSGHPTRLFDVKNNNFHNVESEWHGEFLDYRGDPSWMGVDIFHFSPPSNGLISKIKEWYGQGSLPLEPPSKTNGFSSWKPFRPARNNYKGSNLDDVEKIAVA